MENQKIDLLRHNARSMVRELGLLNDAYFEIGVTLAERHLLLELTSCNCSTMGEIAERLLLDKSTASRLIAKAIKKGYVKCTSDDKDKRKRFLHLTPCGKKTLEAFEPIALNQTKKALLTLSPEEAELVYQGVALYAKGLKNSRLENKSSAISDAGNNIAATKKLLQIYQQLDLLGFTLGPYAQKDENCLYAIFRDVVNSGSQFPYECSSIQEFYRQFFAPKSDVYVCHSSTKEVVGAFYLRPNYSGRSSHIANAAYMIKEGYRGRGIGTLLVSASLEMAKGLGFQAMQFNLVLSQNANAIKLYQKLGFSIIGALPEAIRNPDGSYQDGYIMHRKIN
jgi:DNA-binding MarR family transcriptional regulator/RimJ/RimL family protein N-acetyltransferase